MGNSDEIDLEAEVRLLDRLQDSEVEFLVKPSPQEFRANAHVCPGSKADVLAEIESEAIDTDAVYQQAMALAHDKNVSQCGAAIAVRLDEWNRAV